jgi:phosphate starvation-inducible membrane PsiE
MGRRKRIFTIESKRIFELNNHLSLISWTVPKKHVINDLNWLFVYINTKALIIKLQKSNKTIPFKIC